MKYCILSFYAPCLILPPSKKIFFQKKCLIVSPSKKIFAFFKITIKNHWKSLENLASNCVPLQKNFWALKNNPNCAYKKKMKLSAGGEQKNRIR